MKISPFGRSLGLSIGWGISQVGRHPTLLQFSSKDKDRLYEELWAATMLFAPGWGATEWFARQLTPPNFKGQVLQ